MMKKLILFSLLLPLQVFADTSLWKVSKNGKQLFIGGTVHVLGKKDYPLPQEFERAFQQAQLLVLETDLNPSNQAQVQQQLIQKLTYTAGDSLKHHLKPSTYQALKNYLNTRNISIDAFLQFKPTLVMLTLMATELQRLGLADAGVDAFFNQKALTEGKKLGQLESVSKQIDVLENMGQDQEDELILSTLDDLKKLPTMMQDLKTAWRAGNLEQLENLGITPLVKDYPKLYQTVLVERNMSWLPQVENLLQTPETELILVGALHLAGKDGLLAQLLQRGYKVESF